jgi:hypothetical protein
MNRMAARVKIFDLVKMLMVRGMSIAAFARKHDFKDKTAQKVILRYRASERKYRRTFDPSNFTLGTSVPGWTPAIGPGWLVRH